MSQSSIDFMFKNPTLSSSESDIEIEKFNVHCYKYPGCDLVYIGTYKCASTYYKTMLISNGWDQILFSDIDWDKHRVFGFIIEPKIRFMKGLVQDLCNAVDDQPELFDKILDLLSNHKKYVLPVSEHSLPLAITLKDYMNKIDWIPIDDGFPTFQVFLKLLDKFNLTVKPNENIDPNISNGYKRNLYKKYAEAFGHGNQLYNLLIAGNTDLFNEVKQHINHRGHTWEEISWLSNKNKNG